MAAVVIGAVGAAARFSEYLFVAEQLTMPPDRGVMMWKYTVVGIRGCSSLDAFGLYHRECH